MNNPGKIIGIDYGDARIGIAISDIDQTVAFGRTSIQNDSMQNSIDQIKQVCDEENVVEIVVGYPLSMDGGRTEQTKKVEVFVEQLKESLNIPVNYNDERLTTAESDAILYTLGVSGSGRSKIKTKKKENDRIAASLILENYLNLLTGKQGEKL